MAKTHKKRRWIFPVALLVYALVFLCAAVVGFEYLWDYMDAYEQTRPHIALDAYVEQLSPEYIADASGDLIAQIDPNVQTEEECRQVILSSLQDELTCVKNSAKSSEDHYVYVIRCGKQVVGSMEMERKGEQIQGFTPWTVTGDSFDLSYLLTEPVSVTVPDTFTVSAFGKPLGSEYITEAGIPYSLLSEYYEEYTLPHMATYTAGPFLGEGVLTVTDTAGAAVTIDENTDMNTFLNNCTAEEISALDAIIGDFIQSYVDFTSCTGNNSSANYNRLAKYMVSGGELAKRMKSALDGLYWVSDRGATLTELTVHNYVNIGDGRYLCDVTYVVDTSDFSGSVQTTATVKLILLETADGLRAEAMTSC